jgi:hypothetical protein
LPSRLLPQLGQAARSYSWTMPPSDRSAVGSADGVGDGLGEPVGAENAARGAHLDFRRANPDGKDVMWRSPSSTWPSFVFSS